MKKEPKKETSKPLSDLEHRDMFERSKTVYDLCKHMTTLSGASIVLLMTALEKLFKKDVLSWLVKLGMASFLFATLSAIVAMLGFASYSRTAWQTNEDPTHIGANFLAVAFVAYVIGVGSIAVCFLLNL